MGGFEFVKAIIMESPIVFARFFTSFIAPLIALVYGFLSFKAWHNYRRELKTESRQRKC
jgi:hypothetical protein